MKETGSRVVLITSNLYRPFYGGVENSLYYLAQAFRELGWKPILCCSNLGPKGESLPLVEYEDGVMIYRYKLSPLKGASFLAPLMFLLNVIEAVRVYRKIRRIHQPAFSIGRFHFNVVAARLSGLSPIVYLVPGIASEQNNSRNLNLSGVAGRLRVRFHNLTQSVSLAASDTLAVFSGNMLRQVRAAGERRPVQLCKPGIDPERFHPLDQESKIRLRKSLGAPTAGTVFLCVGRMVKAKGFDLALTAFLLLENPRSELWFVGDGPEEAWLRSKAESAQVPVRFWGSQARPEDFYAAADCFLMSSRYEPLGQVILEAMGSGLLVAAFSPGLTINTATLELVPESERLLAKQPTAESLAEVLSQIVEMDPSERARRSSKLREHVVSHFTWRKLAEDLLPERLDR